ncbi:hypothetical protein Pmani_004827 [Petrolisthes manimaculis]|uniref:Alpha-2-macroglobulin n=1 Tax=Petrolisthes manimaculis TaxID=1843537 RepID=A0AAE1QG41_9EUCA|nr:hypothetical protein Pmani_004827 [Petrolisthes manimaculis]
MALCLLFLGFLLDPALGGYLITTPRQWISESPAQVCVSVEQTNAVAGTLHVTLIDHHPTTRFDDYYQHVLISSTSIDIPEGPTYQCHDILLPAITDDKIELKLSGFVSGVGVYHEAVIQVKANTTQTFLQTDKYLYLPEQKVQMRAITVVGPELKISTAQYPKVWVTTPSRTRIAQWQNVTTINGLIHLDMRLIDEPEKGIYTIHLLPPQGNQITTQFKVEDFVLPRFEVTLLPPPYSLATDTVFSFTVCANYTFGQPVKGNLSTTIDNNKNGMCRVHFTRNITIFGCTDVEATAAELQIAGCKVDTLSVNAVVTEEGTGVERKASTTTSIQRTAIKFNSFYKDEYMKPNLPYTFKVRAERPDNTLGVGIPVELCAVEQCKNITTGVDGLITAVLPNYKSFNVRMKAMNCRVNMHSSEYSLDISHFFSPSNSSILIYAPEGKLKCPKAQSASQHILPVLFSAKDQPTAIITVQVISRGSIQYTNTQEYQLPSGPLPINTEHLVEPLPPPLPGTVRGAIKLPISLPDTASPTVKVLIWYIRADGEVVSDTRELKVEKCLPHQVNLQWSTPNTQPGHPATLTLTSLPEAVCSLGVVDKSSELLAVDPDPINLNKLFSLINTFKINSDTNRKSNDQRYCKAKLQASQSPGYRYNRYSSDYVDALTMFDDAGVHAFTDYTIETRPCVKKDTYTSVTSGTSGGFGGIPSSIGPSDSFASSFGSPGDFSILSGSPGGFSSSSGSPGGFSSFSAAITVSSTSGPGLTESNKESVEHDPAPRTNFPEAWLWDLVVIPASGVSEQPVTVPDTITQWVGKAVCAHPQKGIGMSAKSAITAFTPFFVDLTLPPKMKQGEILPVKMSIFNYLDQPLPVSLTLEPSPQYEILEEAPQKEGEGGKRSACVPPNDKKVLTVRIKPSEIADVNISVVATVDQASQPGCGGGQTTPPQRRDALVKTIKVEAEGFLLENSWSKYLCSIDFETGEDSLEAWQLTLPSVLVEGSARGWVTAVGDLLTLTLENLGNLIRMPYGCGEQNMINFAPNIFILRYLDTTKQNTSETRTKLLNFMNAGYRRELLYRRTDGSYSAFGNADDSGSTWLTAFVLKSFQQAQQYIQIDTHQLVEIEDWLLRRRRNVDGCFESVGRVINKDMQGGLGSGNTVSLTAYVMAALLEAGQPSVDQSVSMAARCLTKDNSTHPYVLAIKAYAFALASHPSTTSILQKLFDQAVVTQNAMYWNLPKGSSKAASLETAGYAILAMMTHDAVNNVLTAGEIVKWITTQRNGQGGFYSTQDTIVALQALATYEGHLRQGTLNVKAVVTANNFTHTFNITDNNKLLEQYQPLPTLPTTVSINMTGQGCAVLQAVLRYNIPQPEPSDAFTITVNTTTEPDKYCKTKRITACTAYHLSDHKSNMAVIEVDLISGYIPEKQDLERMLKYPHIKRYEVDGSKINFYMDELVAEDLCVNFRVIRELDVEDVKPGTIIVYDYYQPELSISKRYTMPPPEECQ